MRIVVDSNVVVSAILNKSGKIGQLLIFGRKNFDYYAPNLLKLEIKKHKFKLLEISKLSDDEFDRLRDELFECITFISEEQISFDYWHNALAFVREVDMDDIAFVALSDYLDAKLWTGDKRLLEGLERRGYDRGLTTGEIYQMWTDVGQSK